MAEAGRRAVTIFFSYSHKDEALRDALETHLASLKREGLVETWHDRKIAPGETWAGKISEHLERADVVLLLVSADFLASDYCYGMEMERALARHEAGEARVVPVILRTADWTSAPFAKLQALPKNAKPVVTWKDRDEAFVDVARGLRRLIEDLQKKAAVEPNPFAQTMAIQDPTLFVGRTAELRRLRDLLDGGSVAIVGPSKVGKSSLLWRLIEGWDGSVVGPLDLQVLEDADDLYEEIAKAMSLASSRWKELRDVLMTRDVLLLLDELDSGQGRVLESDHMARFRAVCNRNPRCKIVTVSRNAIKTFFPDAGRGSTVYSFLQPMVLELLTEADARRLLAHPWAPRAPAFDSGTVQEVLDLAGLHPFKLQRAAYHRYAGINRPHFDWKAAWRSDMDHML